MTMLGLVTFFGLALVTVDILGGVLAAAMLARGVRPAHLLWFIGGYAVVVTAATVVLKPVLTWLGGVLAPVLGSATWLGVVQILVGAALLVVAAIQRRSASRPRPPAEVREVPDRIPSLILGGAMFSATVLADPAYPVAIGMTMQVGHLPTEAALLVAWNLAYQSPLVIVTIAGLLGCHRRAIAAASAFFGPRRRGLLLLLAGALAALGSAAMIDAVVSLLSEHRPWLQSLVLLRERHV